MKGFGNTKLIFLQPPNKQGSGNGGSPSILTILVYNHRFWLIAFLFFFTFASLLTLFSTAGGEGSLLSSSGPSLSASHRPFFSPLPADVFESLVNYAASSNSTDKMSEADLRAIARVLRRRAPCNLLVFGVGHETPLWRALNHGGRTVFLDEDEYYIAHVEGRNPPGLEAYEVSYTTKVSEFPELLVSAREHRRGDCRPMQNLLFSDCRLALNGLPNHLYDVPWDVILVDGPKGYLATSPGRMSAIFTAAVMARTTGDAPTDVLVHDYEREVERVSSEEFLCPENMVSASGQLAHFVIRKGGAATSGNEFCVNRITTSLPTSAGGEAAAAASM